MQQDASGPPAGATLDYAGRASKPRHSIFGAAAVAMAGLTVGWLLYVQFARPRFHQGGPIWEALWRWALLPGLIGLVLAVVGVARGGRKRFVSILAIVVIVLAYLLLPPPLNFA